MDQSLRCQNAAWRPHAPSASGAFFAVVLGTRHAVELFIAVSSRSCTPGAGAGVGADGVGGGVGGGVGMQGGFRQG